MAQQNGEVPNPLAGMGAPATPVNDNPIAGLGTPAVSVNAASSSGSPEQPSLGSRVVEGVKQFAAPIVNALKPPETPTEQLLHAVGGDPSLDAYRLGKGVVEAAQNVVKAGAAEYPQAVKDYQRAVQEFHNKDYRNAASSAVSTASDVAGVINPMLAPGAQQVRELSEGARPGANLATPLTRQALTAGAALIGADPEAAADVASGVSRIKINPFRNTAAADAETAVRGAVQESANVAGTANPLGVDKGIATNPILENASTVVDEPLKLLQAKEKAAYDNIDKTVGFDLKAAKQQLKDDQYAVKQPGFTPEAQKSISDRISDTSTKVAQAETKLKAAGLDPKAGDSIHTARMAGQDFKNSLVKSTSPDGTITVDKLLNQGKALRFSKRGDRLAQFMGKDGADEYMSQLEAAQKAGVHAMKVQKIGKWVAGIAGTALGLGAAEKGISKLLAPTP